MEQEVSGCLRALTGAQQFCIIRCYLSTPVNHGQANSAIGGSVV